VNLFRRVISRPTQLNSGFLKSNNQAGIRRVRFPVESTRQVRRCFWSHDTNFLELYECRCTD
jgi:hypothetical protein